MILTICISTFNRNLSLEKCLKSINNINNVKNMTINVIVVDNSFNFNLSKIKKKIKKNSKYKIKFLHEKKRGIVYARNKALNELKKINPKYISFLDDDCIVDKYWLKNIVKTMKLTNADVVTGPQMYLKKKNLKKNLINYSEFFEKTYKAKKICRVTWSASNNVFLKYSIIKKNKLVFDKNLNKFGVGEDQLFFLLINKIGYKIYWNEDVKVYESIHEHRLNLNWLIRRSFRLGVLGHYIDIKIFGNVFGLLVNYLKSIYYFIIAFIFIFYINKNYGAKILNYFARAYGRLIGYFVIKKIDFFKK